MIISNTALSMVQNLSRGTRIIDSMAESIYENMLDTLKAKCQDGELEAEPADSSSALFLSINISTQPMRMRAICHLLLDQSFPLLRPVANSATRCVDFCRSTNIPTSESALPGQQYLVTITLCPSRLNPSSQETSEQFGQCCSTRRSGRQC